MGDVVDEQKIFNAQLCQKIHIVENSLNQKVDGLQSEIGKKFDNLQSGIDQKFDNLHKSISRLANQQVHQEEECLSCTMVEEQCQQHLLLKSLDIGATVCPWGKNYLMLTKVGSGKEAGEELQKLILHSIPINLDPNATAQPKNNPLPVHILPTPAPHATLAPHATPETPTVKVIPFTLPALQNLKKLVAFVQTFATTSKTLATAHTAWHSGWFGCWFRHEAPGPQHFRKLHQFQQPPKA